MTLHNLMKKLFGLLALLLALAPGASHAEIERLVLPCEQKICFQWWPKLAAVEGWHHDRDSSLKYSYNAQVPDGSTFENADTVIYAKALLKPSVPELTTLEMVIENDQQKFVGSNHRIEVNEAPSLTTSDGKKLKSFTFHSLRQGTWDRVTYGEDERFYLIFTLSAGSDEGYQKALPAYEQFITRYKD